MIRILTPPKVPASAAFCLGLLLFSAHPAAAQFCVDPPPDIVAWWPFEESSGTTALDVIGGHVGTYVNGPQPSAGKVGRSLRFDGTDDYVAVPDSDLWTFGTREFTIEFWVNFSSAPQGSLGHPNVFVGTSEGPFFRDKWFFAINTVDLEFGTANTSNGTGAFSPVLPFSPRVGDWYHLAVVRVGASYSFFVDGRLLGAEPNIEVLPNVDSILTIGRLLEPFGGFLDARIDEMTIYDRALTSPEIDAIYRAGAAGKCRGLRVVPDRGGDSGQATVRIFGSDFHEGVSARLVRGDGADLVGSPLSVESSSTIVTTFDLVGAAEGEWDVVVSNPDGSDSRLVDGFVIEAGREADVWAEIVGLDVIRAGRPQTFYVIYGNRGNVDGIGAPVIISGMPPGTEIGIGSALSAVPSTDQEAPLSLDDMPVVLEVGGELGVPLFIPTVPPGASRSIPIRLTAPLGTEPFSLRSWINTFVRGSTLQKLEAIECVTDLIRMFLFPDLQCKAEIVDAASEIFGEIFFTRQFGDLTTYLQVVTEVTKACAEGIDSAQRIAIGLDTIMFLINPTEPSTLIPEPCLSLIPPAAPSELPVTPVGSFDPNDKLGTRGVGEAGFLPKGSPGDYLIRFENLETATAPAQEVIVRDQLDTETLDLSTFSLGTIAFGDRQVVPPLGAWQFATQVDLRPEQDLVVDVVAGIADSTGLVEWRLTALDPATGFPPEDPLAGFLPPNFNPPEGEGALLFTIFPETDLSTGVEVQNSAEIVFDNNEPIITPVWLNTIDRSKPSSRVLALNPVQEALTFSVEWTGEDEGAGVRDFSVYVSEDQGPFEEWLRDVQQTLASFIGEDGKIYAFYSVARDLVGNVEEKAPIAEAETQVQVVVDQDDDGVLDEDDQCPESDLAPTVVLQECDSGVPNTVSEEGCTISDDLLVAAAESRNHGHFMRRVVQLTEELRRNGTITGRQAGAIRRCAAQASVP